MNGKFSTRSWFVMPCSAVARRVSLARSTARPTLPATDGGCWMVDQSDRGTALNWRKSSASNDQDDCVEVATTRRSVLVRDSHAVSAGMLELDSAAWRGLLERIVNGDL